MAIDYGSIEKSLDFLEKIKKKQEILSKCELKIGELYKKKTTLANYPSTFYASVQKRYEDDNKISPILFVQKVSLSFNGIGRTSKDIKKPASQLLNNVIQEKLLISPTQKPDSYSDQDDCQIVDEFPCAQENVSASPDRSTKLRSSASIQKPSSPQRHDRPVSPYQRRISPVKKSFDGFESSRKSISPSSLRREIPLNLEKSINPILEMAYGPMRGSSSAVTFNSIGMDHHPPEMASHSMEFHQNPLGYIHPSLMQETGASKGGFGWPKIRPRKESSSSKQRPFNPVNIPTLPTTPQSSYITDRPPVRENIPVNRSKITLNLLPRNNAPDEASYLAEVNNFLAKVQGPKGDQREKVHGYGKSSSVVLSSDDDDVIYVGESKKHGSSSFKESTYHSNSSRDTRRYREGKDLDRRSSRSDRNSEPRPIDDNHRFRRSRDSDSRSSGENRGSRNDRDPDPKPPGEEDVLINDNDFTPNIRHEGEHEFGNNSEPGPPGLSPPPTLRNICPDRLSGNSHFDSNIDVINNSTKSSTTQHQKLVKSTPCPNLLVIVDNKRSKKCPVEKNKDESQNIDSYKKSSQINSDKPSNTSQKTQLKDKEPVNQAAGGGNGQKRQDENNRSIKPDNTERNFSQKCQVVDKDSCDVQNSGPHLSTQKGNNDRLISKVGSIEEDKEKRDTSEGSTSHNPAEGNLTKEQASSAVREMPVGQVSEKGSSQMIVKLKDIQSIFSEDCKMARDLREIQQNCSRLKIVYINTQRHKTINKNLCIRNELLCLDSEKLGLRIIASTVEEQVIHYFHCLAGHTNNILPSLLRKYFTPIKELSRKIESVHKSCKECSKLIDNSSNNKISEKDASLKSGNSSSHSHLPDDQEKQHQIDRNSTKPKHQPPDSRKPPLYPKGDKVRKEPVENVDLSELDQPSRAKDPMSIVKDVQSKSPDIRRLLSNINDSKHRSVYFLKNNLLLKRCKQDGKIVPKIFIPNDITDEIIGVVHTKFLFHGNTSCTMNVMLKHFSPISNLTERIDKHISLCRVCKTN